MPLRRTGVHLVLVAMLVKVGLELQGAISTEASLDQNEPLPIGIVLTGLSQTGSNPIAPSQIAPSQIAQNPTGDPLSGQVRSGVGQIARPRIVPPRIVPRAARVVQVRNRARNQVRNLVAGAAHKRVADLVVRSLAMEAPRPPVAANATQLRHNFIDSNG